MQCTNLAIPAVRRQITVRYMVSQLPIEFPDDNYQTSAIDVPVSA